MSINAAEALWLDASQSVTLENLIELSGLTESEVLELIDAGALVPLDVQAVTWTFAADCVLTVRQASRMRQGLELDVHSLALAISLLDRIRALEQELARLRAQLPVFRRY